MERLGLRKPIRAHLARQGRVPAFAVHRDARQLARRAWRWLKSIDDGADSLHITVVSTVQRITEYRSIGAFGLIVLDDEHINALGWMQSLRFSDELPIFVQTELMLRAAERCLEQSRWREAAAICQRAHWDLHRHAELGRSFPAIDRPQRILVNRSDDGELGLDLQARHAIPIAAHFVVGHEIGHHVVRSSDRAAQLRATANTIVHKHLWEGLEGTYSQLHAIVKPSSEYTIGPAGEYLKSASRGTQLLPALARIEFAATEELVADLHGLLFATAFCLENQVPPGALVQTLLQVFEDLLMNQLVRIIADNTPASGTGGAADFPYGRYAYRASALPGLIAATLAGTFALSSQAINEFRRYWQSDEAQAALDQGVEQATMRSRLFDQVDILARGGFVHAVMTEVPAMPPYPAFVATLPPQMQGTQIWVYAPFTVPKAYYGEDAVFVRDQARLPHVYRGFATACQKIAAAVWSPDAVFETFGNQYLPMTDERSLASRFEMARHPRLDVVQRMSSFDEIRFDDRGQA
ncbi:hypothetical protein [Piscinibacter terrae]|uniref:Uncharacterized protein n=1 Tax=Piscinibacter terrae TaxID=2496871 RepID=A0A3N7HW11_9BURK|nr:hypothetical protein [Albitalea terrae]RQP26497.1 hypothetical protein DZC73_05685 [Albitalea terrae]